MRTKEKAPLTWIVTLAPKRGGREYAVYTWAHLYEMFDYFVREGYEPAIRVAKPEHMGWVKWYKMKDNLEWGAFVDKREIEIFYSRYKMGRLVGISYRYDEMINDLKVVEKFLSPYVYEIHKYSPPDFRFPKDCDNGDDIAVVTHIISVGLPFEYKARLFILNVPPEVGEEELKGLLNRAGYRFGEFGWEWGNHAVIKGLYNMDRQLRHSFHEGGKRITFEALLKQAGTTKEEFYREKEEREKWWRFLLTGGEKA